jgi:signal transduction histidine kinase/ligand-binding sensor domain-containing protein
VRRREISLCRVAGMLLAIAWTMLPAFGSNSTEPSLRSYILSTWTTAQGLPQDFVTAMAQTPDGFLWVGTMNGLARFDGLRFHPFDKEGPPELQNNIGALVNDGSGGLWIVTDSGLLHYEHSRFHRIPCKAKPRCRIDTLARTPGGELWIYAGGRLFKTERDKLEPSPLPTGIQALSDMAASADGTLWLADRHSVFRTAAGKILASYELPGIQMLYVDRFGGVWAGDGHHLFRFNGQEFKEQRDPGLGNFVSVMVDSRHQLWMASGGLHGISRKSADSREVLTTADGLASNDTRLILEDRNHDIWLGTIAGLQRLHRGVFTTYSPGKDLQIESIFEQKDGSIWAGTLEGGVAHLRNGQWQKYAQQQGLPAGQVRGFFENGALPAVAISDYGIFEYHRGSFAKRPSIPHGYIDTPVTAGDGSVWFNVHHRGIFRLKDGRLSHFDTGNGLAGNQAFSLAVDAQGTLWVGGLDHLQRWNGQRFESVLSTPAPVLCVAWPKQGGLAVGTLSGLLLRTGTSNAGRMLTQNDGLPGNTVLDVVSDDADNLWIATTSAIARIPHAQWRAFADGATSHIQPELFTEADGLKSRNVLPLNQITTMRAHDGRIWFATAKGLSVVDPHLSIEAVPDAVIENVTVDDQLRAGGDQSIQPGRHRMAIAYTSPANEGPEQTSFRYRLSGWDREWISAGTSREVSYTGLPPGDYVFEVTATNRQGLSSAAPARIHLTLLPFFWQTRWFLVLVIVVTILAIVEITRRYTRRRAEKLSLRFQERAAERERIAYQIHDTVIQDMIGATLQLELIGFQLADQRQQAEGALNTLAARMRETIARSRNMVSNLHSTAVAQYSLVEVLRHAEAEFRLGDLPRFDLTSTGEPRQVHPLVRDEVYRICREALANAFRHSNAEFVAVEVRFLPDMLEVEISDDGLGMSAEILQNGRPGHFGLRGMQAHADRIGATLTVESNPGQGTNVILRVKARRLAWWRVRQGRRHPGGNTEA